MTRKTNKAGFSLVELAMVLVIIGLLAGYFVPMTSAYLEVQKVSATRVKLNALASAFSAYVSINGRLPCPADGSLASTVATAGKENGGAGGCTASQINGVVPWIDLGLSEADILDSWNSRITYRLGNNLWLPSGMDMSDCDPAGNEVAAANASKVCNSGCSAVDLAQCTTPAEFLQAGKGLTIRDKSAATAGSLVLMNAGTTHPVVTQGAAYVLISHGKNVAGAFRQGGGSLIAASSATDEAINANGVNMVQGTSYFVDREINDLSDAGANYFDDLVLRPSIMKVLLDAGRGARAH